MLNKYPLWKYLLVLFVLLICARLPSCLLVAFWYTDKHGEY